MDKDQLEESKNQSLERGVAFQELTRSRGWRFVKMYFENEVKAFTTSLLVEDKPIESYANKRSELNGIRKLFGFIDHDIKFLENEHTKDTGAAEK
jgi:hypothetical protein